jgi:hypothetical protein
MFYQTESKMQGWRALAILEDGAQHLLYLGRSMTQVRAGYAAAFAELLDEEEQRQTRKISVQCWQGAPDAGSWLQKTTLSIPGRQPALEIEKTDLSPLTSGDASIFAFPQTDEPVEASRLATTA